MQHRPVFPETVLDAVEARFGAGNPFLTDFEIIRRPLNLQDPALSLGLYVANWMPMEDSHETMQEEPTITRYNYRAQIMVKHTIEEQGRVEYTIAAKVLRGVLYRDQTLQLRLRSLTETVLGYVERFQRFGVTSQRFLNNEVSGENIYMATTDFWIETESIKAP